MVVVPVAMPKATPELLASFAIEAMAAFDELQVTEASCCMLPSLKVPLAIMLCEVPTTMLGFAGVTAMDTNPAGVNELGGYSSADAVRPPLGCEHSTSRKEDGAVGQPRGRVFREGVK
jgi:hypothetical protein